MTVWEENGTVRWLGWTLLCCLCSCTTSPEGGTRSSGEQVQIPTSLKPKPVRFESKTPRPPWKKDPQRAVQLDEEAQLELTALREEHLEFEEELLFGSTSSQREKEVHAGELQRERQLRQIDQSEKGRQLRLLEADLVGAKRERKEALQGALTSWDPQRRALAYLAEGERRSKGDRLLLLTELEGFATGSRQRAQAAGEVALEAGREASLACRFARSTLERSYFLPAARPEALRAVRVATRVAVYALQAKADSISADQALRWAKLGQAPEKR